MSAVSSYLLISSRLLSIHLRLGRALRLFPGTTMSIIFLDKLSSSLLLICPYTFNRFCLRNVDIWRTYEQHIHMNLHTQCSGAYHNCCARSISDKLTFACVPQPPASIASKLDSIAIRRTAPPSSHASGTRVSKLPSCT